MATTQRNFEVIGSNLITIANMILNNQNICKLLYYTTKTPLSETNIEDTSILMDKNIRMVPQVPDEGTLKGSFIVVLLDNYDLNPINDDTNILELRFDILCPMDEWRVNEKSLRPFLIMSEMSAIFNGLQIKGIGKLKLLSTPRIVMSDVYAGYSMLFNNHEFN